jgi:hypothetical protein
MGRKRLFGVSLLAALVLAWLGVLPAVAQTKTARGTVTAVSDSALTVKVADKDMTFAVDDKTIVQAKGAGRRTRTANETGAPGVKITDYVKTGGAVLVTYHEANGKMHASEVRPIASAGSAATSGEESAKTATGTVKSVSADSLTVSGAGKDWTFAVNPTTKVLGKGAGTATTAAGGRIAITSLVSNGDQVSVNYREAGSTMTATQVRVVVKSR